MLWFEIRIDHSLQLFKHHPLQCIKYYIFVCQTITALIYHFGGFDVLNRMSSKSIFE